MKPIFFVISVISILILYGPYSAFSHADRNGNLEIQYGVYIAEYILKLESKTVMRRNTESEKFRKQALLNCLKLSFLTTNEKGLAKTLEVYGVALNSYNIQRVLNMLFFNSVKRTMKTAGFYSCRQCGRKIDLKTLQS